MQITEKQVYSTFGRLMGENGDNYATECLKTGKLSETSFRAVCDNISFNSKESVINNGGLVLYFYLKGDGGYKAQ